MRPHSLPSRLSGSRGPFMVVLTCLVLIPTLVAGCFGYDSNASVQQQAAEGVAG